MVTPSCEITMALKCLYPFVLIADRSGDTGAVSAGLKVNSHRAHDVYMMLTMLYMYTCHVPPVKSFIPPDNKFFPFRSNLYFGKNLVQGQQW